MPARTRIALLGLSVGIVLADSSVVTIALPEILAQYDVEIETLYCPHAAGPPVCWCRKPLPGLPLQAILAHRLDPTQCLFVGDGPQDPGFARRLGFGYRPAADLFAAGA